MAKREQTTVIIHGELSVSYFHDNEAIQLQLEVTDEDGSEHALATDLNEENLDDLIETLVRAHGLLFSAKAPSKPSTGQPDTVEHQIGIVVPR